MIQIPQQFQLGGRTWTVEVFDVIDSEPDLYGDCDSVECVIRLKNCASDIMQHTFYHELTHAICYTLGWKKFNEDEDKIDTLANLFLQFLKTRKGKSTTL